MSGKFSEVLTPEGSWCVEPDASADPERKFVSGVIEPPAFGDER